MKRKFIYKITTLFLLLLFLISGFIGNDVLAVKKETNRYNEVFDISEDVNSLVVRFLYTSTGTDTKSGDSAIVKTPDGKVMLIDGSAPETAPTLSKYLDDLEITKIDAVVASHPHIDHIGGLTQIIYDYDVEKVYRSEVEYPSSTNREFLKAVEEKKIDTVILRDEMIFNFGETKIEVFNPTENIKYPAEFPERSTSFLNDNSIVLKISYKESTVLFTGDIYITGEKRIIESYGDKIKSDILKIPHHGDDTSSSSTFIKTVQPQIAVAIYDRLASLDVYNTYRNNGSEVYLTAIDGNVKIVADGTKEYKVITEKDRVSNFLK